jgi:hypothetical protein
MKPIIAFLIVWLILAGVGYSLGSFVFDRSEADSFAEKGNPVYGKVTAKDPNNHAAVSYIYKVNEKEFQGIGGAGRGNPSFDQLQIGQQVVVFYNPLNPQISMLGYPQLQAKANQNVIWFTTIAFPVFPMLLLFLVYRIYISSKRSNNS